MSENLVFVSCGQTTDEEKLLGLRIKEAIDNTPGFRAYFAETVHELQALGHHVFNGLLRCSGAVVVLHARGPLFDRSGAERGQRSSVWVNQEIAILAYRQFCEERRLPLLCFREAGVALEGATSAFIINPLTLGGSDEVLTTLNRWLLGEEFGGVSTDTFWSKWSTLDDVARTVLAALIEEGGRQVAGSALKATLRRVFGVSTKDAPDHVVKAAIQFQNSGLVIESVNDQGRMFSLHPTWEPNLRREVARWRQTVKNSQQVV